MGARYFGAAVARIEDPRLISGRGNYIDDIALAGNASCRIRALL